MSIELAGFVIANREREILTCRYSVEDYLLYEAPTVPVPSGKPVDRECVATLAAQLGLRVTVREQLSRLALGDIDGVTYACTWLLADVHNTDLLPNRPDSQWHYLSQQAMQSGECEPGPHTSKLLWAITNEEIRLK